MAASLGALLPPRRPGLGEGERRIVTLTREGGIGKTALALEMADWCEERAAFPGGIFELACEHFRSVPEWLSQLLDRFGVPLQEQRGDLLELLAGRLAASFPPERPALLLLDNLDDLFGRDLRRDAAAVLETALTATPALRVLATCRWPLGLADHETEVEIKPLDEAEACNVFLSHLTSPTCKREFQRSWGQENGLSRQLIALSGRHPQSLRLLARQLERPGMTLKRLVEEARADLLKVLVDPLADDEASRLEKVKVSCGLSYRHLSEAGKLLFAQLSRLPGGVWCGKLPEHYLGWAVLLGENWRAVLEQELEHYALVHYEPSGEAEGEGRFAMLPSMLEFAGEKYRAAGHISVHLPPLKKGGRGGFRMGAGAKIPPHPPLPKGGTERLPGHKDWEAGWLTFWRQRLDAWDEWIKGRVPEDMALAPEFHHRLVVLACRLFEQTQANWLAAFDALATGRDGSALRGLLLRMVKFLQLSGQRVLERELTERAVTTIRQGGAEADLALCLIILGIVLRDLGEREAARAAYEEALGIYRRLAGQHPAAYEPAVAATLNNLGIVLGDLGEREAARAACEEALGIYRRLAGQHPAAYEPYVAMTLNNLGIVLGDLGEREAARAAYEEALAIRRRLAGQHPAAYEPDVAMTLNNLGIVLRALGEREAARAAYEEALRLYRPFFERWPQAFGENFFIFLRNYTNLVEETEQDPWWQLWREWQTREQDE